MTLRGFTIAALSIAAFAAIAAADDSGNFIVRLGRDTTGFEHYRRTSSRIEVDQLGRSPRLLRRHFIYDFANGSISRFSLVVTPPGSTTPTQNIEATFGQDSMRMESRNAGGTPQKLSLVVPPGTTVVASSSPWSGYETAIMKFVKSKTDSLRTTLYYVGADEVYWLSIHRLGRDSVSVFNQRQDQFHARIDKSGRILGVLPIAGTAKFSVERLENIDMDALTAAFAAREQAGGGLGALSPRDTVRFTNAAGAAIWIDYGRPAKRGRVIFGNVVPYGEVWRTGANAATQLKTDVTLDFGGMVVPPGFYTLWTIPSAGGWKLVVNSETGQWGTEHKADKDLYTIPMNLSTLPQVSERFTISVDPTGKGGVLNLDWDTTRASAEFSFKQ